MNFTQMHERLRLELLRRIQRGSVSVSLLSRQTGLAQAHLSNFLRGRRNLSLDALDRVLGAQHLTVPDILPSTREPQFLTLSGENTTVPVVSHATALFEPFIRSSAVQSVLPVPIGVLQSIRAGVPNVRRSWQRFVAVRVPVADALPMEPLVLPEAIVLIDRHYNSLEAYRPSRPNLYAVRQRAHLTLRYVELVSNCLVLRPYNLAFPVELIEVASEESAGNLITGRIAFIVNGL
jgi:transcriptional regulator with XRE-family HTH domain